MDSCAIAKRVCVPKRGLVLVSTTTTTIWEVVIEFPPPDRFPPSRHQKIYPNQVRRNKRWDDYVRQNSAREIGIGKSTNKEHKHKTRVKTGGVTDTWRVIKSPASFFYKNSTYHIHFQTKSLNQEELTEMRNRYGSLLQNRSLVGANE